MTFQGYNTYHTEKARAFPQFKQSWVNYKTFRIRYYNSYFKNSGSRMKNLHCCEV